MDSATHLKDEYITRYKEIYKEEYGKEISNQKALEELISLVRLLDVVYKFNNKKNYEITSASN